MRAPGCREWRGEVRRFSFRGVLGMKMQSRRRSQFMKALGATTILAGLAFPGMALAAEDSHTDPTAPVPAASVPVEDSQTGLGDIVVTATRRSESIQKVPISMQALDM